jgi:protein-tyrosine phosphatase
MIAELNCPEKITTNEQPPIKICFVCSGNTCRSPMAAAVLNHLGKGAYKCSSAGLCAVMGDPISKNAIVALQKAGIESTPENNYLSHRAKETSDELLERFDKIVAISRAHMINLLCTYPHLADKITVMSRDIPDPFMSGEQTYVECLKTITTCLKEMFSV